jgi:prevent-host-death family protein
MVSFTIDDARARFVELIRRVRAGREVILVDAGTPFAKLVPVEQPRTPRVLGTDAGKIWIAPDAFDPLTGDDLKVWEESTLFPEPPKRQNPSAPHPPPHPRPRPDRGTRR